MADAKASPDTRFRSFAERWVANRCHLFSTDPNQLAVDTWKAVQDARRAYKMVYYVSFTRFDDPEAGIDPY